QERSDESGEELAAATRRESGVAARHYVDRAPQVGDDRGDALEEHRALDLLRRLGGGRPPVVRRRVGELVAELGAKLAEVRGQDERSLGCAALKQRSEEHTSELQSPVVISYA